MGESTDKEIMLEIGQSAEPDHCGSCAFFTRSSTSIYDRRDGQCNIKLPPHFAIVEWNPEGARPRAMEDVDRCDLHKHSGRYYIVQRRISAP